VRSTLFLRGDGGQGEFGEREAQAQALPEGEPDRVIEIPTDIRCALIYRLSGDWNPLHADPAIAREAGFERPIMHGLCTNGIACRAVLREYCGNDPDRLRSMFVRFSAPSTRARRSARVPRGPSACASAPWRPSAASRCWALQTGSS
jgi:acyl dehydratase